MTLPEIGKIQDLATSGLLAQESRNWMRKVGKEYTYQFEWLGLPIIQYPTDVFLIQELFWKVKPRYIIETGIARGGSILLSASLLALLDLEEFGQSVTTLNPSRRVFGIDIEIREHASNGIGSSFLKPWIELIESDSTAKELNSYLRSRMTQAGPVIVILDSNHTHEHVLAELNLYCPFVTPGSYIVVMDTEIEFLPSDSINKRVWGKGNNPHTAVVEFLESQGNFEIDQILSTKLGITCAPDGFLRRVF